MHETIIQPRKKNDGMLWESRLSTLRVNANSDEAEDGAEAESRVQ